MNIEYFTAGKFERQYKYDSFLPSPINQEWQWSDPRINTLLEEASRHLAELDAFSLIVQDVDLFIKMHTFKEASLSSRIEGTKTEMDEALLPEEEILPERRDDWVEVNNYVQAMNYAIDTLNTLPLSNRLLKKTHEILMQGVRGETKTPGEYRRSQNWIGGSSLADAAYIPPSHEQVPELMSDLEKFWHNDDLNVPHLIRVAISHYQFETIHPFLDGNGRIGRLLIPLYLIDRKLLKKPSLYISAYFERNRTSYYDALSRVRSSNDLGHWLRFFLNGISQTATNGVKTFQHILRLRQEIDETIMTLGRRLANGRRLVQALFQTPVISVNQAADQLDVSHQTANSLIGQFEHLELLREITGYQRNRLYLFAPYLDIFKENTETVE